MNHSNWTDSTKSICTCTVVSMILIILFIISPLRSFFKTSFLMKMVVLIILGYTFMLNTKQIQYLHEFLTNTNTNPTLDMKEISNQLNMNIVCSYIFTGFIGLLFIFVMKSFFK